MTGLRRLALLFALCANGIASAQQLDTHFSCSVERIEYDEPVIYADSARIKLDGDKIIEFNWESSLFRPTHGFDCSIDTDDQLQAEVHDEGDHTLWRISPVDAAAARTKRGYDFGTRLNCSIRIERDGKDGEGSIKIKPTCPALCGSRANFSAFSVDLKSGQCHYDK
jgi:hypothetical protein